MSDKCDETVGYKKPPRHTRWVKGQSGNPAGRQRGKRGVKTDLGEAIDAKVTIQVNHEAVSGTRQELTLRNLAHRAALGDLKAAKVLVPLIIHVFGIEDRGRTKAALSPHDQALLDELLRSDPSPPDDESASVNFRETEEEISGSDPADEAD